MFSEAIMLSREVTNEQALVSDQMQQDRGGGSGCGHIGYLEKWLQIDDITAGAYTVKWEKGQHV